MTMGLKLASAGDAKDDQKTQNVPENVAKTGRVSLFFARAGQTTRRIRSRERSERIREQRSREQNQVARAEAKQWLSSTLAGRHRASPPCRPRATMRSPCATTLRAATAALCGDEKRRDRERKRDEGI